MLLGDPGSRPVMRRALLWPSGMYVVMHDSVAGILMRIRMAVAAAVVLAGCQSTAPAGETPLDGAPRVTAVTDGKMMPDGPAMFDPPAGPLSPEEIWRVEPQDTVLHIQSGATCPGMLGGLRRDKQTVYKPNGMDVGCNYIGGEGPALLRFYIFTSDIGGLDAEVRTATDSMRAQQPIAKRAQVIAASQAFRNYGLVETDANGTMMRNSLLMTQVNGGWILKVRLTCREQDAKMYEELAARMLADEASRLKSRPVPRTVRMPA